jgi:hypothetical protein
MIKSFSLSLKFVTSLIFIVLFSSTSQANSSEVISFNYNNFPDGPGMYAVMVGDGGGGGANYSLLPNSIHPNYAAVFPVCAGNQFNNCILNFESKKTIESEWTNASIAFPETPKTLGAIAVNYSDGTAPHLVGNLEEDATKKIPTGRTSSIWTLPNAQHSGGNQYLVSVSLDTFPVAQSRTPVNFNAVIKPIQYNPNARKNWTSPADSVLAYSTEFKFPENQEYRLTIKLGVASEQISTFFSGRVTSPGFQIEKGILTISGAPQKYPIAQSEIMQYKNLTKSEKDSIRPWKADFFETQSARSGIFNNSALDFSDFSIWESKLKEIGLKQSWFISSMNNPFDCKVSSIAGFVSSNSLLYSTSPPLWDENTSSLNYKMASLHTDSSGAINRGNFDLVISPELAKCLWNINPEDIQSVSARIIYENGESIIGASSLQVVNKWVYVNVKDFTFSNPTVSVKIISSRKSNVVLNTPIAETIKPLTPKIEVSQKKTITCFKGKTTKKMSSMKPSCPAGYKKK